MALTDDTKNMVQEYETEEGITVFVEDENLSPEDLEGDEDGK